MAYISFLPDQYFHIYNRGNNRENIFLEDRNYMFFLNRYQKYIAPSVRTLAFCLLPNHFHFLIRIKPESDQPNPKPLHQLFANMFISYTKAINKAYGRRGSLFEKHLKRKLVPNDLYFQTLVVYIHRNPQSHGLIHDFRDWPFSSYPLINQRANKFLDRTDLLQNFNGLAKFHQAHTSPIIEEVEVFGRW